MTQVCMHKLCLVDTQNSEFCVGCMLVHRHLHHIDDQSSFLHSNSWLVGYLDSNLIVDHCKLQLYGAILLFSG